MNIKDSVIEEDNLINEVICRIVDAHPIPSKSTEPGVEIAQGLFSLIEILIKDAKDPSDIGDISQAIVIGAFRSDRSIALEAHKTLRVLIHQIIHSAYIHGADINKTIQGILTGVIRSAKEHKLNIQEAFIVAREDISYALNKTGITCYEEAVHKILINEYNQS